MRKIRDLINSRFGVSYSNFSFLTPIFWKVSIDKYGKTPTFSGGQHFTPIFKILVRTLKNMFQKIEFFNKLTIKNLSDHQSQETKVTDDRL